MLILFIVSPVPVIPGHQIHTALVQPTTVHAVEQAYFKQHQYIHQMRPLADVIGSVRMKTITTLSQTI